MKKIFLSIISFLWIFWSIVYWQNVQRNLFFEIISSDQLIFNINWNFYQPSSEQVDWWYKTVVTIPKISLQESDTTQKFVFKIKKDNKLFYTYVNMSFSSFEELNNKNKIYLYVWITKPQEIENYIIQETNWIYIQSSEDITYKIEEKHDVSADIIFPNILWVKKIWPILWLWLLISILSSAYLIWKKQVIKI